MKLTSETSGVQFVKNVCKLTDVDPEKLFKVFHIDQVLDHEEAGFLLACYYNQKDSRLEKLSPSERSTMMLIKESFLEAHPTVILSLNEF